MLIENFELIEKFDFMINSNKISLKKEDLEEEKIKISLDKYIKQGLNEIVYYPLAEEEEKSVKVWIEVFKKL